MDAQPDKPIIRNMRIREGETLKLPNDGDTLQEVTCHDIAKLALAMRDHSSFFSRRRGLSIKFRSEMNGGGSQGLFIKRKSEKANHSNLIDVIFGCTYDTDGEYLYEADLIMDTRDKLSVNRGKHRFVATVINLQIDWNSDETLQWRLDIDRLSRLPDTLTGWIEANLEMLVICSLLFCDGEAVLTRNDLSRHVAAGLSLEDLKTRLTCSKCGERGASVTGFF